MDVKQQEPIILFNGILGCEIFKDLFKAYGDTYEAIAAFSTLRKGVIEHLNKVLETNPYPKPTDYVSQFLIIDGLTGRPYERNRKYYWDDAKINALIAKEAKIPVDSEMRSRYKVALLAGCYGASKGTLIREVGAEDGNAFYDMLQGLPELYHYRQCCRDWLISYENCIGYVPKIVRTVFGTNLTIKEYNGRQLRDTEAMLRLMLNYPIQGTGADLLKFNIVAFYEWTKRRKLKPSDMRIMVTRHDEMVFLIKNECMHYVDELKSYMEIQVEDWTPLRMDCHIGTHYQP
jgi:hypothetical protein